MLRPETRRQVLVASCVPLIFSACLPLASCTPAATAQLGITRTEGQLVALAYSCREESNAALNLYENSDETPTYRLIGSNIPSRKLLKINIFKPKNLWRREGVLSGFSAKKAYSLQLARQDYTGFHGALVKFDTGDLNGLSDGRVLVTRYPTGGMRDQYMTVGQFVNESKQIC